MLAQLPDCPRKSINCSDDETEANDRRNIKEKLNPHVLQVNSEAVDTTSVVLDVTAATRGSEVRFDDIVEELFGAMRKLFCFLVNLTRLECVKLEIGEFVCGECGWFDSGVLSEGAKLNSKRKTLKCNFGSSLD